MEDSLRTIIEEERGAIMENKIKLKQYKIITQSNFPKET